MRLSMSDIAIEIDERLEHTAFRLGDRIRQIRVASGMTQSELGARVGLSSDRVQKYENGIRKPKADLIKRFADALEVSPLALLEPTPSSPINAMYVLFALEDFFGMKVAKNGPDICLKVGSTEGIYPYMLEWLREKLKYQIEMESASTKEERKEIEKAYSFWKWQYPHNLPGEAQERRKVLEDQFLEIEKELEALSESNR